MENETSINHETANGIKSDVIRPCPFCGGEAEIILRGNAFTKKRNAEIRCGNCNVEMVVGAVHSSLEWCAKTVTAKWNKRVGGHGV
jgi:Lar family restriction alleviation protein